MNALKNARQSVGLTQQEVADKLGMARTTVVAIEQGKRKLHLEDAQGMAKLYGVSAEFILGAALPEVTSTDCREADGITVGLIDSLITVCRVLRWRNLDAESVRAALREFASDEDVQFIRKFARHIRVELEDGD